jgi:hypothetical protein
MLDSPGIWLVASALAMTVLRYPALLLFVALSGCSLFHGDEPPAEAGGTPAKKKSPWKLVNRGPEDATPYLEYQRVHSETDKSLVGLVVRNTHPTKSIEGDVRTTIETGSNESKVDTTHFALAPADSKKLLVFPASTHLSYEVTAFFKE